MKFNNLPVVKHFHDIDNMSSDAQYLAIERTLEPVSYTHLDVYKRQADRSYGVHVAKIAGLPPIAVNRAREILDILEDSNAKKDNLIDDLPLFNANPSQNIIKIKSKVEEIVEKIDPNDLTPKQALELIYELKSIK